VDPGREYRKQPVPAVFMSEQRISEAGLSVGISWRAGSSGRDKTVLHRTEIMPQAHATSI